jgi:hypothetical protein
VTSVLSPLAHNVPIVDEKGYPTPYFQRMLVTLLKEKGVTDELAEGAVQSTRQIISGGGLTGGGTLAADRTLEVGAGTGIIVNADDVAADPEYIRDIIAAFAVAGSGVTITHDDGANTLTFASTAAGSAWSLHGSTTIAAPVASVAFTGLANASDILIIGRLLTQSVAGNAVVRVSTNNGVSYYNTSGDYVVLTLTTGQEANSSGMTVWSTAATAARSGSVLIQGANVTGAPRLLTNPDHTSGAPRFFIADTANDIDAVQVSSSAGNFTGGTIYCFKR